MSTKHTPGPWTYRHDWQGMIYIQGAHEFHIASMVKLPSGRPGNGVPVGQHAETQAANARLIATAPELLAAVSELLGIAEIDALDDKSNVWRSAMIDARAAIAKATGETA